MACAPVSAESQFPAVKALVLTQRVIGLFVRVPPARRHRRGVLKTKELMAAGSVFLRVGIGLQSDQSPMYGPMASGSGTYGPAI
jgi:hypothetical protein